MSRGQNIKKVYLIIFLSFYFFNYLSSGKINCSNDGGHYALANAMYYDHTTSIEKYKGKYVSEPDYAVKNNKIYSDRLPGNAFLIMPFLAYSDIHENIGSWFGLPFTENSRITISLFLANISGALALCALLYLLTNIFNLNLKHSIIITVVCGLGTLIHIESTRLFSHITSMLFVSLSICVVLSNTNFQKKIFYSAILIGCSTLIELQNILFVIPIFLYLVFKEQLFAKENIKKAIISSIIGGFILLMFLGVLLSYNYLTFDEWILKSNKYNPFFPEEKSFLSALSGNFFEGLDKLFTSFTDHHLYTEWNKGANNLTPGILVSNPIFIVSLIGFIPFYKKHRKEFYLFVGMIVISVLIAAFHVTTLTRHIFTIHLLLYLPAVFSLEWILSRPKTLKATLIGFFILLVVLSISREYIMIAHTWGHRNVFSNAGNIHLFFVFNTPVILWSIYYFYKNRVHKISLRSS